MAFEFLEFFFLVYKPPKGSMAYQNLCSSIPDLLSFFLPFAALSFGIVVFLYMLGKILKNENLRKYLEVELYDILIFTVLLVSIIPFMYSFNCFSFLVQGVSTYDAGFLFWDSLSRNLALDGFVLQASTAVFAPILTADISVGGRGGVALSGVWLYVRSFLTNTFTILSITISLSYVFRFMYDFLTYGLMISILPLGIALRAIPLTKKFGGVLFGLSLGMSFFLPIISALMFHVTNGLLPLKFDPTLGNYVSNTGGITSAINDIILNIFEQSYGVNLRNNLSSATVNAASAYSGAPPPVAEGFFNDLSDPVNYDVASKSAGFAEAVVALKFFSDLAKKRVSRRLASSPSQNNILRTLNSVLSFTSITSTFAVLIVALSLAFMISLEIAVATATVFISFSILITTIKVFTGMFGEPLDVGNLTRLV